MAQYDAKTALLVVDVQNDFADSGGSLYVKGGEDVVPFANREIDKALTAGALVVYTQDWHPPSTPHFQKDGGIWPVHLLGVHCSRSSDRSPRGNGPRATPSQARHRKDRAGRTGHGLLRQGDRPRRQAQRVRHHHSARWSAGCEPPARGRRASRARRDARRGQGRVTDARVRDASARG